MTQVKITNPDGPTVLINADGVAEHLLTLHPEAPQEVLDVIADLQAAVRAGRWEQVDGLATYLDIDVRPRPDHEALLDVVETTRLVGEAQGTLEAAIARRDDAIRAAFGQKVAGTVIAHAAQMTTTRAYQIRDGRR